MSGKDLFEAMSYVDERFVDEAENQPLPKGLGAVWIRVYSVAACLCLILLSLYNLQPYLQGGKYEGITAEGAAEVVPEDAAESAVMMPEAVSAPAAPRMNVRIVELTQTGFIGTVENIGGFTVFEDAEQITVTVDPETDPDFDPADYRIGDLICVLYTSWDKEKKTVEASILGIVDEPYRD